MGFPEAGCFLKLKTSQMARGRSLIESGREIQCRYDETCTGEECRLSKEPQTRTIYLEQSGVQDVPSGMQRFYQRLEAWKEKNS